MILLLLLWLIVLLWLIALQRCLLLRVGLLLRVAVADTAERSHRVALRKLLRKLLGRRLLVANSALQREGPRHQGLRCPEQGRRGGLPDTKCHAMMSRRASLPDLLLTIVLLQAVLIVGTQAPS